MTTTNHCHPRSVLPDIQACACMPSANHTSAGAPTRHSFSKRCATTRRSATHVGSSPVRQTLAAAILLATTVQSLPAQAAEDTPSKRPDSTEQRMWSLGFQLHGVTDLADAITQVPTKENYELENGIQYGWGLGLTVPLVIQLWQGLGMRFSMSTMFSGEPLFDPILTHIRFLNTEQAQPPYTWNEPVQYRSPDAWLVANAVTADLHYQFPVLLDTFMPYLGAGPGLFVNFVFPNIPGDDAELIYNSYNDLNNDFNIDPYSLNLEIGFDGYLGINFKVQNSMYLNLEASYQGAWMPEAPLYKATDGSDARRAAYYYSAIKIGSGLMFTF